MRPAFLTSDSFKFIWHKKAQTQRHIGNKTLENYVAKKHRPGVKEFAAEKQTPEVDDCHSPHA